MTAPFRFVTLGPQGSNHELVAQRYLVFRGLADAEVILVDDFFVGLDMMAGGQADFMLQVAVHPDCAGIVARAHFKHGIHVIDTFISPSKRLGILTRVDVDRPRQLALMPATMDYADLSAWPDIVLARSTAGVAEGLLDGRYESGLTALDLADRHPGRFRVDKVIGTVDDPWLVYGRARVSDGGIVAWPDSPGARQFLTRSG